MNFPESTSHTQRDLHPYDSQTGLPHFDSFRSSLNRLIETQPPENEVAMIWVDLLNLRRQFLLRGWTGTDSQVRRIADVLRSAVDESALLCRFSARCFALALPFTQPKKQ